MHPWGPIGGAAFLAFTVVAALIGDRQRREGGGTVTRLLAVSMGLAALGCAPLVAAAPASHPRGWVQWPWGVAAALITFGLVVQAALPPIRFVRGGAALPLLEDAGLGARIAAMARAMGLTPPVVRVLRSTGPLQIQAFAGGLPAPSVVLCDGVVHRLSLEERDAVVAHELGHLARSAGSARTTGGQHAAGRRGAGHRRRGRTARRRAPRPRPERARGAPGAPR